MQNAITEIKSKPFLKWAGGKHRIANEIINNLPKKRILVEPFVGAGSVFMMANFDEYLLCDTNTDLINLYNTLKQEGEDFINYSKQFFTQENNTEDKFYKIREKFNETRDVTEKSAIFIYLNKHCFNGLCRYNSRGLFNVPYGKYSQPKFPLEEIFNFYQKSQRATFLCQGFEDTMRSADTDSVIYCDPPYLPLSETSNFSDYTKEGFNFEKQEQLATEAKNACRRGIFVLISNHDTEAAQRLYSTATIKKIQVQRNISATSENRTKVGEIFAIFNPK